MEIKTRVRYGNAWYMNNNGTTNNNNETNQFFVAPVIDN